MTPGIGEYFPTDGEEAVSGPNGFGQGSPSKSGARLPRIIRAKDLVEAPPPEPPLLIHGLLHRGEKMLLGGGSKVGKTWVSLDIAVSVASGQPFMGMKTTKGRVLYVNLELPEWSLAKRLDEVRRAKGLATIPDELDVWTLRGTQATAEEIIDGICTRCSDLALTLLDPLYKLLGSRKENAAEDMAELMNVLEGLTTKVDTALICPAHFAKGDSSSKESIDRISGSGVSARDADAIITMTRHQNEGCFTIDSTLRTMPSPAPFVVRWDHPIFRREDALDPSRLRSAPGRRPKASTEEMRALLPNEGLTHADWLRLSAEKLGLGRSAFNERLRTLNSQGRICKQPGNERYIKR